MQSLGEMWSLVVVGGFVVLGAAMAWGLMRMSRRDKGKDGMTEAATRQLYDETDSNDPAKSVSPDSRPQAVRDGERLPPRPI